MEEKVKYMLHLIEEDGDSFAKRAEMYYRKRPELIEFVEESYRAYRALAERYDHISGELHKANNTIATVFPEQVQFAIEDDDDVDEAISLRGSPIEPKEQPTNLTSKGTKSQLTPKKKHQTRSTSTPRDKEEAREEIDRLQKGILALQTEKEFIKSSYENGLVKYWDIEKRISAMQDAVYFLEDEFGAGTVIEDDEARVLMAATALKSCEDTVVRLKEQQMNLAQEAEVETERIKGAQEKLNGLKRESAEPQKADQKVSHEAALVSFSAIEDLKEQISNLKQFTMVELAEKIDDLVMKVIELETVVISQKAQICRLRLETDELQKQLQRLEEEKLSLTDDSACDGLNEISEKLQSAKEPDEIKLSERPSEEQKQIEEPVDNSMVLMHDLHVPDKEEETIPAVDDTTNLKSETVDGKEVKESMNQIPVDAADEFVGVSENSKDIKQETNIKNSNNKESDDTFISESETETQEQKLVEEIEVANSDNNNNQDSSLEENGVANESEPQKPKEEEGDFPNWQQLFLTGLEDREKILLAEYTSVLRNYKDTKRKLSEMEKKNGDTLFATMAQIRELKSTNAMKDEEIRLLRQNLNFLKTSFGAGSDSQLAELKNLWPNSRPGSQVDRSTSWITSILLESTDNVIPDIPGEQNVETAITSGSISNEKDIEVVPLNEARTASTIEEKFRRDIDELLEENLEFWLRFSTSFHQIQKFQTACQELQTEFSKLKDKKSSSSLAEQNLKSEAVPIDKSLKDMQVELSIWLEQNAVLRDELQYRFSSLCNIQDEISKVSKDCSESEEVEFTAYQAAKFQGEVLNMQQENNKVADELQAGFDHVRRLQEEVENSLAKLHENFDISVTKSQRHNHHHHSLHFRHLTSRTRIPLRSFIFGTKPKKPSMFWCVNPALQKQYSDMTASLPM
ncbi:hypothetical protein QJS10_CPB13g00220 [Acorus calamus]|uniref:NAB domain-containing protein n=1 Tax=Acorus calamus TaxID=4465 RepID=A0AAV9DIA2_ACOCL|nr:hypothetical protein QJS10_CPB13g00220 [Acorus calamus]